MKTSEIKQIIKEEIKSILTESYGDVGNGDKFWKWPPDSVEIKGKKSRPTGYVLLHFGRARNDWFSNATYILNAKNDTWFRRTEGIGKGYGLLLRDLKVGNKSVSKTDTFNIYRARITYWPEGYSGKFGGDDWHEEDDKPANWEKADGLLWIISTVDKDEVMGYINKNMSKWRP